MTSAQTSPASSDHADASRESGADIFAALSRVGSGGAAPRQRVAEVAQAFRASYSAAGVYIVASVAGEDFEITEPSGDPLADEWARTLRPASLEANAHGTRVARVYGGAGGAPEAVVLAAPLAAGSGGPLGGVAIACGCASRDHAERLLAHFRGACAQAAGVLTGPGPAKETKASHDELARVFSKAGEYESLTRFAYAATNAIRSKLGCDQAALGVVDRGRVSVRCVSGLDEVNRRSPGVHRMQQAMAECADRCAAVITQPGDRWDTEGRGIASPLHERWRGAAGGACVASLPILAGDRVVAVLSLRRPEHRPFTQGEIETTTKLIEPLGGALPLVAEATRSATSRAARQCRRGVVWAAKPGSWGRKLLLLLVGAAVAWIAIGDTTYRVTVPASVIAEREHAVAAPIAGRIERVLVKAGQTVTAGDTVAVFDTSDLDLELRQVEADLARALAGLNASAGEGEISSAAVAAADSRALRARRDLLRERIERAVIAAPTDGLVVGDRPELLAGRFVAVGDPLFTIADSSGFSLELRVPDGVITDVAHGAAVRFASHARPEDPGRTTLAEVQPVATERDGKRVFVASAALPTDQPWLRPGMEGVAMVEVGDRPIWWIATHRVVDAARLNFWIE